MRRRRPWRALSIGVAVVVTLGGAAAAAVGFGGADGSTPTRSSLPPGTAEVTRNTLVDFEEIDGELGYGDAVPLRHGGQGVVTWLPAVGSVVNRGQALFNVDNQPVSLLFGALPMYRPLAVGVKGPDVKQFEENLRALGYRGFTVDEEYTSSTANAVKDWQEKLKRTETGTVAPGDVVYEPGAVRIAEQKVRVGEPAGTEVLTWTGTSRLVTVDLEVDKQRLATVGAKVTVKLPDGKTVEGTIAGVGTVASADDSGNGNGGGGGGGQGSATVEVTVTIADQNALGTLQQAPVDVRFVAEERKDVLTVPVAALLALAEGGYGVQVVEGSSTRIIPVETGMFADGRVEVEGELQPGTSVGIPK